jgi:hypothetical protein
MGSKPACPLEPRTLLRKYARKWDHCKWSCAMRGMLPYLWKLEGTISNHALEHTHNQHTHTTDTSKLSFTQHAHKHKQTQIHVWQWQWIDLKQEGDDPCIIHARLSATCPFITSPVSRARRVGTESQHEAANNPTSTHIENVKHQTHEHTHSQDITQDSVFIDNRYQKGIG